MKILAGRPKDIDDVRSLLRERLERLDLKQIRELLGVLEEALHQSDLVLVPVWDRELATARRRKP